MTSQNVPAFEPSGYHAFFEPGYLKLQGETHREFLQRQTTNNIDLLTPERSLVSVLTSPTARILDVLVLLDEGGATGALTLPGRAAKTARYLKSRIFFADKVTLTDASESVLQLQVFGPRADLGLAALAAEFSQAGSPPELLSAPVEISQVVELGSGIRAIRMEPTFGLGYRLLTPAEITAKVEAVLNAAGLERISPEEFTCLRVEAGLPTVDQELTEEFTPLETGLLIAVSDTKGCYTGQEVIARQITYDKVNRLLCGLRLSGPVEPGSSLTSQEGAPAGKLTSMVESPRLGWIGLGVVKRPYHTRGTVLRVGPAGPSGVVAKVGMLPFSNA